MKIPKKIQILGRTYDIVYDDKELESDGLGGKIVYR
jgi:hypothetical protein